MSFFLSISKDCGGTITEPGDIKLLTRDGIYLGGTDCVWKIQAPSDKSVVLRFESFVLESSYRYLIRYSSSKEL